jgi:hypothetical protein
MNDEIVSRRAMINWTFRFICEECIHFRCGAVESHDIESFIIHIKDQVLTLLRHSSLCEVVSRVTTYHDGETDKADISTKHSCMWLFMVSQR